MYSKLFFARAALVAAGCVATSVVIGGPAQSVPVQPAGSTSVSPAGASVTATSVGSQVLEAGAVTVTCKTLNAKGSVPAAPDNQNANGPVSVQISAPTFSDCETDLAGVDATVTTTGTWAVTVQNGSVITGSLTIPKGGMTIKTSGLASCTTVVAPDGPATIAGTFTNGNPPTINAKNAPAPIKTTGGFGCPTDAKTGTLTGTSALNNVSDPSKPITVGP
ncbi:hypothetical protein [Nocardia pseudobrasiliensis]|uniref:Ig-like domain-containing protein n=1 Tax=Nocardia pseudobrasiliensis TaxID=45979 RepID=A0A370HYZ9_9NOCA|nr:hypothetical protein [Nocardia pseudobrasiliensis]RDI63688.1 hypothetical protein DFR76_10923 [Nocardia pseudobrasiliensis]